MRFDHRAVGAAFAACVAAVSSPVRAAEAQPILRTAVEAPVAGAPAGDDVAKMFFGTVPDKAKGYACFERIYDAAHLAKHPLQKVGSMLLLIRGEKIAEDPVLNYSFSLGLKYKNKAQKYTSGGYCGHIATASGDTAAAHCGVDCDGGSLDVVLAADGKSVLVSLERIAIWIEGTASDGPEDRTDLEAGADDKSFRLVRVPAAHCKPLVSDKEEVAEMMRGQ